MYLLIKYIKSVLWRVAKRLSYIEDARCLKVNTFNLLHVRVGAINDQLSNMPDFEGAVLPGNCVQNLQ